jgi:hypothetical protein
MRREEIKAPILGSSISSLFSLSERRKEQWTNVKASFKQN